MKFIARKGAVDVPLEILEAQESGALVFFCGAGISFPAKLPSFSGLVDKVYESLATPKDELELEAIKDGLYDRALGLLERRIQENKNTTINHVRQAIIRSLKIPSEANLDTHKAILDLSSSKSQNYRLVTTNVDHGFLLANDSKQLCVDAAPKLPVPKPHKWESLVHLHGIIDDENDPNGEHLIFTSGDFGSAYLTERWASKFVTELFSHYIVLFVGYSINDPVLRYMTDAISAEMRLGYNKFHQPYVIAHSPPKKIENNRRAWVAKGVEPIFYSGPHSNLHSTLKAWANYSRDGLNGKERIIRTKSPNPPVPPYDQDESVKQVIDTLKEKTTSNHDDITGHPAKIFGDIVEPATPIEWLPILYDEGLLSIAEISNTLTPVTQLPMKSNLLLPNKTSLNLWCWLLKHLESDYLIYWVIDNGVCLHPKLGELVAGVLDGDSPPKEPYLKFWRIVTSNYVKCGTFSSWDEFVVIKNLNKKLDILSFKVFCKLLEPKIRITKSYFWLGEDYSDNSQGNKKLYDLDVSIDLSTWLYQEVKKLKTFPIDFHQLLIYVSNTLNEAMKLWEFIGYADEKNDRSNWDIASISPHKQNVHSSSWCILIELCRDLWVDAYKDNSLFGKMIIDVWKSFKYPVFRRLVLYVFSETKFGNSNEALEFLLEDNNWWLWAPVTQREKFRLLESLWFDLTDEATTNLINIILKGPPRSMYRENLSDSEWNELVDHKIWIMLNKLKSYGGKITEYSENVLDEIQNRHPNWSIAKDDRDEFTSWIESTRGYSVDITTAELFSLTTSDLVNKLREQDKVYSAGRIDIFRLGAKDYQDEVVYVLTYLIDNNIVDNRIWHAGLVGMSESDNLVCKKTAKLLVCADDSLFSDEAWAVSWWTRKMLSNVEAHSDGEQYFWPIANKLIENSVKIDTENKLNIYGAAINDPIGIIAEALIDRFTKLRLKADAGIPKPLHLAMLNKLLSEADCLNVLGRVIIASRLQYFFAIDPEWTRIHLLPLFSWETSSEAAYMWQGYLRMRRVDADLALEIHELIFNSLEYSDNLTSVSDRLHQLFVIICLEYPTLYSTEKKRSAMKTIGKDGIANISKFLWKSFGGDKVDNDNYWNNRVKPFIKLAWPRVGNLTSPVISKNLALMSLQMDDNFGDAVEVVKPFLVPFSDLNTFLHRLELTNLIQDYPSTVFELISSIYSTGVLVGLGKMREVLNKIVGKEMDLKNNQIYREIDIDLRIKGF